MKYEFPVHAIGVIVQSIPRFTKTKVSSPSSRKHIIAPYYGAV
jgi:hypothetical protein